LLVHPEQGIQVPASINRFLREYQRDGVRFFWDCYKEGRGGVLGDDMGLGVYCAPSSRKTMLILVGWTGKTIQVISFLAAIMHRTGDASDEGRRRALVSKLQDRLKPRKHTSSPTLSQLPPADAHGPTCLIIAPVTLVDNWARELETWGWFEWAKYTSSTSRGDRDDVRRDFVLGRLDIGAPSSSP
jgi:hypothetical protein